MTGIGADLSLSTTQQSSRNAIAGDDNLTNSSMMTLPAVGCSNLPDCRRSRRPASPVGDSLDFLQQLVGKVKILLSLETYMKRNQHEARAKGSRSIGQSWHFIHANRESGLDRNAGQFSLALPVHILRITADNGFEALENRGGIGKSPQVPVRNDGHLLAHQRGQSKTSPQSRQARIGNIVPAQDGCQDRRDGSLSTPGRTNQQA